MSSKKRLAAIAVTIAALTAGSTGIASAHDGAGKGVAKATMLAELVKAGTITQVQADAIIKMHEERRALKKAHKDSPEHKAAVAARKAKRG